MAPRKTTHVAGKPTTRQTAQCTKQTTQKLRTRKQTGTQIADAPEQQKATETPAMRKRKQPPDKNEAELPPSGPPSKKARHRNPKEEEPIIINRAPVLELWSACVTHFLHPELKWATCLSIGSAISSITAISKGRSIGMISKPDPSEEEARKRERRKREQDEGGKEIKVMGFHMRIRDDAVVFMGKPRPGREVNLVRRFGGEENLRRARRVMEKSLGKSWKGREDELDKKAFSLYEGFRPDVPGGQRGWGSKGELSLTRVEDVVRR